MYKSNNRRRRIWIVGLLFLLTLLLLFSTGKRGFIQQVRVRIEKQRLEKERQALEARITELEKEKKALSDPGPDLVEKMAREEGGMAKKDEKVYIVVPKENE